MKKIIALVVAIIMMAAIAVPAFAADETFTFGPNDAETGTYDTTVEFGVTGGYTVTIPQKIVFDSNRQGTATITASSVVIAGNEQLHVTVYSENYGTTDAGKWVMEEETGKSTPVDYTITMPGATQEAPAVDVVSDSTVIVEVTSTDALTTPGDVTSGYTDSVTLSLATAGTSQVGKYLDTLTFSAAVIAPQQNG